MTGQVTGYRVFLIDIEYLGCGEDENTSGYIATFTLQSVGLKLGF